jgi:hypothetical protein
MRQSPLESPIPPNEQIGWFATRQEFNERSEIVLLDEFLGNGWTVH